MSLLYLNRAASVMTSDLKTLEHELHSLITPEINEIFTQCMI